MLELSPYYIHLWIQAFAFTQAIEIPVYTLFLRMRTKLSWWECVLFAFGASALTHPLVWFAIPWKHYPFEFMYITAELFAFGTEAIYLKLLGISWKRALMWSFLANLASAGLGEASRYFLGWP